MPQTYWEDQFLSLAHQISREPEADVAALLEDFPKPVFLTDAEGWLTHWNSAAVNLWGVTPKRGVSRWCGSYRLYTCDGAPLPHDECPMAIAIKQCRPVRQVSAVLERPDGRRIVFTPYPTPLYGAKGNLIGAAKMLLAASDVVVPPPTLH